MVYECSTQRHNLPRVTMPFLKFLLRTALYAVVGVVLLVLGIILTLNEPNSGWGTWLGLGGIALICTSPVIAIVIAISKRQQKRRAETAEAQQTATAAVKHFLISAVDKHEGPLRRNLRAAVKRNAYGTIVEDNTDVAVGEFVDSIDFEEAVRQVIASYRKTNLKFEVHLRSEEVTEIIQTRLNSIQSVRMDEDFDPASIPFDGNAFEDWVAAALQKFGWDANTTSGGADQGIDVLARKNGKTLALQCKLYSSAVGNKAVQEAFSGAAHYDADAAAVISNSTYTSSAEDLASTTGVKLFSQYDIPNIYRMTFEHSQNASSDKPRYVPQ